MNHEILVGFLPEDAVHLSTLDGSAHALTALAFEQIRSRKQSVPCLYPDSEQPYLLSRNNLKSSFFYIYYALAHFDQIIADGPDYVISGNQKELHIVIANRTGKSVRHAFSIKDLPTDYICQEFTIRPEQESEESVFPAGAKIHLEEIREHVKARAFPPGKITHIERTPEYHLYTLTYPDAITYISFMGC